MLSISKSKNLEQNAFIHEDQMCERINYCCKLVGKEFFEKYNIKVIKVSEFYDNTFLKKWEYMKYINDTIIKILIKTKSEIREDDKYSRFVNKFLLVTELDFLSDDDEIEIDLDLDSDFDEEEDRLNDTSAYEEITKEVEDDLLEQLEDLEDLEEQEQQEDLEELEDQEDLEDNLLKNVNKSINNSPTDVIIQDNSVIILNDLKVNNIISIWKKNNSIILIK